MEKTHFADQLQMAFELDLSFARPLTSQGNRPHPNTALGDIARVLGPRGGGQNVVEAVEELVKALLWQVKHPVRERVIQGRRFFSILGVAVFEERADGSLAVWLWSCDESGVVALKPAKPDDIMIVNLPGTHYWMDCFINVFVIRSGVRRLVAEQNVRDLREWLVECLQRLVWSPKSRREVRMKAAPVLRLNRRALDRARSIPMSSNFKGLTRLSAYNQVVRHLSQYELLEREAPCLVGLLDHLSDEIAPRVNGQRLGNSGRTGARVDVKLALKQYLVERGIRPAFWRMLTRISDPSRLREWLHNLVQHFRHADMEPAEVAVAMLLSSQAGGTDDLAHAGLMMEVFDGLSANADKLDGEVIAKAQPLMVFIGRLRRLRNAANADEQLRVAEAYADIMDWALREHLAQTGDLLERAQLPTILRLANPQRAELFARFQRMAPFPPLFDVSVDHPQWEVVPLSSALELWREGEVMRHCVADFHRRAAWGISIFASIRYKPGAGAGAGAKPLATFELDLRDGVSIYEIKGFGNRDVDEPVLALARACAARVRAQMVLKTTGRRGTPLVVQADLFNGAAVQAQPVPDHRQFELAAA